MSSPEYERQLLLAGLRQNVQRKAEFRQQYFEVQLSKLGEGDRTVVREMLQPLFAIEALVYLYASLKFEAGLNREIVQGYAAAHLEYDLGEQGLADQLLAEVDNVTLVEIIAYIDQKYSVTNRIEFASLLYDAVMKVVRVMGQE